MKSTFINLHSHAKECVGLEMDDKDKVYPNPDYMTIRVPLLCGQRHTKEGIVEVDMREQVKAGSRVKLIANCLISPKKNYHALLTVNPALHDVALTEYQNIFSMQRSEGGIKLRVAPYVWCEFKRSFDLTKLDYLFELRCIE